MWSPRTLLLTPALLWSVLPAPTSAQAGDILVPVEVTTVAVDLTTGAPLALLRDRTWGQVVPIWIAATEAEAIARALAGAQEPQPSTHDLLANVIREMGGTVEGVEVHSVPGNAFLGRVHIQIGSGDSGRTLDLDSGPGDALALAVRTGATVRVEPAILERAPNVNFLAMDGNAEVVSALGITVTRASQARRREFSLPNQMGMVVLHVTPEVSGLGLQRGDLLVEVNGDVPTASLQFVAALTRVRAADTIRIVYVRDGVETLLRIPPGYLGRPAIAGQ